MAAAAAVVASTLAAISTVKSLTQKQPKTPDLSQIPTPDAEQNAATAAAAGRAASDRIRQRASGIGTHGGTLLTGPSGVTGSGAPVDATPSTRKTLLGF